MKKYFLIAALLCWGVFLTGAQRFPTGALNESLPTLDYIQDGALYRKVSTANVNASNLIIGDDEAYNPADWDGDLTPPTKNAVNDLIDGHIAVRLWVKSTLYAFNRIVANNGVIYVCKLQHTSALGNEPGTGLDWTLYWDLAMGTGDGGTGDGIDSTALHKLVASEIHALTQKSTPANEDEFLIESAADSWAKQRVALTDFWTAYLKPLADARFIGIANKTVYDTHLIDTDLHINAAANGEYHISLPQNTIAASIAAVAGWGDLYFDSSARFMMRKPGAASAIQVGSDLTLDDIADGTTRILGSGSGSGTTIQILSTDPVNPSSGAAWVNTTDNTFNISSVTDKYTLSMTETAYDTTPAAFSFVDVADANLSTEYTSAPITLSGTNKSAPISVSGGSYSVNSTTEFTTDPGLCPPGASVRARVTSSSVPATAVGATVTIGTVSDEYTVTTASSGGSTILQESFETPSTGYEETWTESNLGGTFTPTYVTYVNDGTQSLFMRQNGGAINSITSAAFTPQSTIYFRHWVRWIGSAASYFQGYALLDASDNVVSKMSRSSGVWKCSHGTIDLPVTAMESDTDYYIWGKYVASTGSDDGILEITIGTTGTKLSGTTYTLNTGTSTADVNRIQFNQYSSFGMAVDSIEVSTTPLGDF